MKIKIKIKKKNKNKTKITIEMKIKINKILLKFTKKFQKSFKKINFKKLFNHFKSFNFHFFKNLFIIKFYTKNITKMIIITGQYCCKGQHVVQIVLIITFFSNKVYNYPFKGKYLNKKNFFLSVFFNKTLTQTVLNNNFRLILLLHAI